MGVSCRMWFAEAMCRKTVGDCGRAKVLSKGDWNVPLQPPWSLLWKQAYMLVFEGGHSLPTSPPTPWAYTHAFCQYHHLHHLPQIWVYAACFQGPGRLLFANTTITSTLKMNIHTCFWGQLLFANTTTTSLKNESHMLVFEGGCSLPPPPTPWAYVLILQAAAFCQHHHPSKTSCIHLFSRAAALCQHHHHVCHPPSKMSIHTHSRGWLLFPTTTATLKNEPHTFKCI